MCVLSGLTKVEEREMPLPWVVYEGVYTPQNNASSPQFSPAEVRMRFGAPAANELALKDQLNEQAAVPCHAPMTPGTCLPGTVVADVQPFDPTRAQEKAALRPTGCAAIEAASEQDRLNQSYEPSQTIPERFTFNEGSAEVSKDATETANAIAKRMAFDANMECVGVIGQISAGESPSLAEARARAVKALLESLGVDKSRLMTVALTSRVYGPASNPMPADPGTRRVSFSVLLGSGAAPAPASAVAPGN
jgi:outer membrane protein OmpA-like peptidoglycan-associated protein